MKKIEPVAWKESSGIITEDFERAAFWRRNGFACEPLYTREALEFLVNQINHAAGGEIDTESILIHILGE